jgi:hypothetical protein
VIERCKRGFDTRRKLEASDRETAIIYSSSPSIMKGSLEVLGPCRPIILSRLGSGASSAFRSRRDFLLRLDDSTIHQHNGLK